MSEISVDRLIEGCGDRSLDGGIAIRTELEPLAGPGAPVKPAIYSGGVYQMDRRWWGDGDQRRPVDAVVIDNVPSQANRLEAALEKLRSDLGLPEVILDLTDHEPLPPHVPRRLSSFRFPHRQADGYIRDAILDGTDFIKTETGRAIVEATADRPLALLEWFPQALLFGFWQSHFGKKGSQAKLARSWVSEIVGYDPAVSDGEQLGLKGDPLNLSVDEQVQFNPDNVADWDLLEGSQKVGGDRAKERLSEIGHGQVPVGGSRTAVSFSAIQQQSTVSFAALRRVWVGDGDSNAAGRAVLASLGLVAHVSAFGRAFSLRSGCELRPQPASWLWLGATGDEVLQPLTLDGAILLFREVVQRAEIAGLPVGSRWADDPLVLTPKENLAKAIRSTYPRD